MIRSLTVLCVGEDPMLLQTRAWILARHFDVGSAGSLEAVAAFARTHSVDLIVLCHSMSTAKKAQVTSLTSALWPKAQVLEILSTASSVASIASAAQLPGIAGPEKLLKKVAEMLGLPGAAVNASEQHSRRPALKIVR